MSLCQICGNELSGDSPVCIFCGSSQKEAASEKMNKPFTHRTVNIEEGLPFVEQAMKHLDVALQDARLQHITVLTVIHGYGSSGKGGAIRQECRKILAYLRSRGEIEKYIAGEDFYRKNGPTKDLLNRFPQLKNNSNLNRRNQGVTLVIL